MNTFKQPLICILVLLLLSSCKKEIDSNQEMVDLLTKVKKSVFKRENSFYPEAEISFCDSIINNKKVSPYDLEIYFIKSQALLKLGDETSAIKILDSIYSLIRTGGISRESIELQRNIAIAYLRLGERKNCILSHNNQSCIFPIKNKGIQTDVYATKEAIKIYEEMLAINPNDLESRWLLNIAYMAIGDYPDKIPSQFLIKGLMDTPNAHLVKPFEDFASNIRLNKRDMSGGSIVDDFTNDGKLDVVTSSWGLEEKMHFSINNGNGSFIDASEKSGLSKFTGGLNIMQTDYNNDGYKDIFVMRGAWKMEFGNEPNSLLRNNKNGTFTDVTRQSGLLSFHPTQTATWNDFNNDGWLDVFIGNESPKDKNFVHPCELYINNKNGTFTNTAVKSKANIVDFVKGVTSGDYDNDGYVDIFISTLSNKKVLLKNKGIKAGIVLFEDVTEKSGMGNFTEQTFPTWFWDYDNDGFLDIFVCGYEFGKSLGGYSAAEALNMDTGSIGKPFLFRNKQDGTFEEISKKVGLNKTVFAMGSNFGDINNDGFLDIYLGTGNPQYQSLVPNKMFLNLQGNTFADVTNAARVGNLQKGHAVSFCDLDNDGDQDIFTEMGGAYTGDSYENSFYNNPGQNNNNWITLQLEGAKTNKAAIGAKIKVTFIDQGKKRSVYRDVNSGGSFGSNPLKQHIGIGEAKMVESIEIKWPVTRKNQVFKNVSAKSNLKIKEGESNYMLQKTSVSNFSSNKRNGSYCPPGEQKMSK
jgi:FG-GAP-like repeat/ASPIC and UnbV